MEKVYLLDVPQYEPGKIAAAVKKAATELNVSWEQKSAVLLADCPWAHPKYAPHAHTNPQFVEGVAEAFKEAKITLAANSLTGFPTRYSFRHAGYGPVASRLKAQLVPLDEVATQTVALQNGKVSQEAKLPSMWMEAGLRVAMPKLRQSTLVPFAGALRLFPALLPQKDQLAENHRLPEKMVDLLSAVPVDLIVVDAIQVLHKGGELSGLPLDLGLMVIGTNAVAVDMVCAVALGLDPETVDFLREAKERGAAPVNLGQIEILGDLSLDDLRARSGQVQLADPNPANYALPAQVKVMRSEKARQAGVSGVLADVFYILRNAGISMKSSPLTTIVIGDVSNIPKGKDEYSTVIFMDDTSRGDMTGYGRIVRLAGRNIALSQVLNDVPYAIKAANVKTDLGADFMLTKLIADLRRSVFPRK
jgi:uncharacterized protein (DUF362 family)